jgi:hypothetical protein
MISDWAKQIDRPRQFIKRLDEEDLSLVRYYEPRTTTNVNNKAHESAFLSGQLEE